MENYIIDISIILPVYNAEKYITRCLDSIRKQSFENWECIIVNDGSTDYTNTLMQEYCEGDGRFQVICKENEGAGIARNHGISIAKGEFIFFIDADDWMETDYLSKLYTIVKENPSECDLCGGKWKYSNDTLLRGDEAGNYNKEDMFHMQEALMNENKFGHCWGYLFRRNIIADNNLSFNNGIIGEDCIFMIHYLGFCKSLIVINDVGINYEKNNNVSITKIQKVAKDLEKEYFLLTEKYSYLETNPRLTEAYMVGLRRHILMVAKWVKLNDFLVFYNKIRSSIYINICKQSVKDYLVFEYPVIAWMLSKLR